MAKRSSRMKIGLICSIDDSVNYVTEYNRMNTKEFPELIKYCPNCRKHTTHKTKKKLH